MADMLRTLSPEELAAPCAKFCGVPEVQPSEAVLKAFAAPMDCAAAIPPQQINRIFEGVGGMDGYCLIPCEGHKDGGYASFTTVFPHAALEMLQWWFPWRGLSSINYTASNSTHNHSVGMSEEHRNKILSPVIPLEAKSRGIIQSVVKDTGICGLEDFIIHFARPEEMEIDPACLAGEELAFFGGWWMREDRASCEPYKKAIDMFAHVCRQEADGVRVKTYLWCGYRGLKGKNMRMDTYGPVIDGAYVKQLALAGAQEMAHLAGILPALYEASDHTF